MENKTRLTGKVEYCKRAYTDESISPMIFEYSFRRAVIRKIVFLNVWHARVFRYPVGERK